MSEIDEAASIIAKSVDPDADIIFGAVIDESLMDQIKITLIATKFDDKRLRLFRFKREEPAEKIEKKDEDASEEKAKASSLEEDIEATEEELLEAESEFDIPAFLRKK